jgi:diguanylate cyclase (GGDEF)-like protein
MNWLVRTAFFVGIGTLAGMLTAALSGQLRKARRQGRFDSLTNLPNTECLTETLQQITRQRRYRRSVTLISVGISNFYGIMTAFGNATADALKQRIATRLTGALPEDFGLHDLGGGAFAVILRDADFEHAFELGRILAAHLDESFMIENIPILASGHFGIAHHPQHASDAPALLRASLSALREAIQGRLPHAVYDVERDDQRRRAMSVLTSLKAAISDQLILHYQPKIDLQTGDCVGVEALVRWNHPVKGCLTPDQFIPFAEQTALISPLTERVMDLALEQLARWWQVDMQLMIAVNISAANLKDHRFVNRVRDLIRFYGVDPRLFEVEITETSLIHLSNAVRERIAELRGTGVRVSLDDFGTGQSALANLRELPLDGIKLDRSFVRDLLFDQRTRVIVGKIIEAAHELGLHVVAEGIEEQPVASRLRELSCDYGQGYLISQPLPASDFEAWFSRHQSRATHSDHSRAIGSNE